MLPPPAGKAFEWDNIREPLRLSAYFTLAYSALHILAEKLLIQRGVDRRLLNSLDRQHRIYLTEKYAAIKMPSN
jgi:hypothetical protein